MSAPGATPILRVEGDLTPDAASSAIFDRGGAVLGAFARDQRWYGDKGRTAVDWRAVEVAPVPADDAWFLLTVAEVSFADGGERSNYFVPLAIVNDAPTSQCLAVLEGERARRVVVDALHRPGFAPWFLERFVSGDVIVGRHGTFRWEAFDHLDDRLPAARQSAPSLGSAEQSNSSLRYGDALYVKVFRRLRSGVNPDEEVGRFLSEETSFHRLPPPLGAAAYTRADGTSYPLAFAQAFVPSLADGWRYTLDRLAGHAQDPAEVAVGTGDDYAAVARLLGVRIGELHLALAADTDDLAFAPVTISAAEVKIWEEAADRHLAETAAELEERRPTLEPSVQARIDAFSSRMLALHQRVSGFGGLLGTLAIRVHGDLHLGQILRTTDHDWVILDFEGEPARPIAERRAKTSPLKDVAGMLRSFAYARAAAERQALEHDRFRSKGHSLVRWERAARAAFLDGYRTTARARIGLVPADDAAFTAALAAWELDKALYEIAYEVGNRPDWLPLPLDSLLTDEGSAEPPDY